MDLSGDPSDDLYHHQDEELALAADEAMATDEPPPPPAVYTSYRPKLIEILKNLHSLEKKIFSEAADEFITLLQTDSIGGDILREYVHLSPKCCELSESWKLHAGKPGIAHVLSLVSVILDHPIGKSRSSGIKDSLDIFARSVFETKLDDMYDELRSQKSTRQGAALSLLAAVVRRGSGLASEVTKSFDFKLPVLGKLAGGQRRRKGKGKGKEEPISKQQCMLRRCFVRFAVSFIEVGNPRLLRWVLQQRDMYSGVLRRLGSDDEETVVYVLSVLRDKVLTEDSLVPPRLRSVLFGIATLEQLCQISGNPDAGSGADIAHEVLVRVCTDPCNGLMPGQKLKGNEKRLFELMKKLKATEISYHRELLLAIVNGRPSLCAVYMDEFPYHLEPCPSSSWFAAISLAADLISSINANDIVKDLGADLLNPPDFDGDELQNILKCIIPRAFARSVINKGLLHKDALVKHGSLRLLLEAFKSLGNLISAVDNVVEKLRANKTTYTAGDGMTNLYGLPGFECFASVDRFLNANTSGCLHTEEPEILKWVFLKQYVHDEVRAVLPGLQVLLSLQKSSSSNKNPKQSVASLKRCGNMNPSSSKKLKIDSMHEDIDIVIGGIDAKLTDDVPEVSEEVRGAFTKQGVDEEKNHTTTIADIWGLYDETSVANEVSDADKFFHAKLLDVLTFYMRTMPADFEGSFDFFKILTTNPLSLSIDQQRSLLSLLVEYIRSRSAARAPELIYKHLHPLINLLVNSQVKEIQDQAYVLARAAMISTGAFDQNISEIDAWFYFLSGYNTEKDTLDTQEAEASHDSVILFLCDAVSTVGNNLYKYLDHMRKLISNLDNIEVDSIGFSPLIVCILQKCLRLLESDSGTYKLHERSMISLYVCNTLSLILQTQVEMKLLPGLIHLVLTEKLKDSSPTIREPKSSLCEWRPLKNLLSFVQTILDQQSCSLLSISECTTTETGRPLFQVLAKVKEFLELGHDCGLHGVAIAFSSSIVCATPGDIITNFPLLLTIAQQHFRSHLSFLSSVLFLERDFLVKVANLWPDMCFSGLEMLENKCSNHSRCTREHLFSSNKTFHSVGLSNSTDHLSSIDSAAAFSLFLKHASFYALFPAILTLGSCELHSTRMLHTIHSTKILDFLRAKLSEGSVDDLISYLRFMLFWTYQIVLSYRENPSVVFEELFQMSFSLVEYIFEHLLVVTAETNCLKSTAAFCATDYVQVIVDSIFHHPLVTLSLSHPLCCGEKLRNERLVDCVKAFLSSANENFHSIHYRIMQFPRKVFDCLLSLENGWQSVLMSSRHLGQKSMLLLREELDHCVVKRDLGPLLHRFYTLQSLLYFLSSFELLEFALWMFLKIEDSISASEPGFLSALSVGVYIADGAFALIYSYLQLPNMKSESHLFWDREDKSFDVAIIPKIYYKILDFATSFDLECAEIFLSKAVGAVFNQWFTTPSPALVPLYMLFSRLIVNSPTMMLLRCIYPTSKIKAKTLLLLTELNPLYMSLFGHTFLGILERKMSLTDGLHVCGAWRIKGELIHDNCIDGISRDDYVLLLPAALSYLKSNLYNCSKQDLKIFQTIAAFYSEILLDGFSDWNSYVSRSIFEEDYQDSTPISLDDFENLFNGSLLGKAVIMLCYSFILSGDLMSEKKRSKIFNSTYRKLSVADELLDNDLNEFNTCSFKESLILINKVVAKINFTMLLLVPPEIPHFLSTDAEEGSKETILGRNSNRLNSAKLRFLNILVNALDVIVRRFPLDIDCCVKACSADNSRSVRFLEYSILKNILRLSTEIQSHLIQLPCIPFMPLFIRSCLLHRFGDPVTLKAIRCILVTLSEGNFFPAEILELVLAHSQFISTILSKEASFGSSAYSSTVTLLQSVPSILKSLDCSSHQNASEGIGMCDALSETRYNKGVSGKRKLELIKLLRVLYYIKGRQQHTASVNVDGMNLRELLSLLLSGYGATLSEIDLEMLLLMDEIELTEGSKLNKKIFDLGIIRDAPSENIRDASFETRHTIGALGERKLELIKMLRLLYHIKRQQQNIGTVNFDSMNYRELLSPLLSGYGVTHGETDFEMLLMDESELTEGSKYDSIAGVDYLWGSFALKVREEQAFDISETSNKISDFETIEERRKLLFRENIPVDSKLCALTVLNFCYNRSSKTEPMSLERLLKDNFMDITEEKQFSTSDIVYDPAFILRFSIYSLLMGYIEPLEFSRLGLLAITFVSISSPDDGLRNLAYVSLIIFKKTLENHQNSKDKLLLQLLLTFWQNEITEPWQRIPSVTAVFAAEASFALLDYSHDNFLTITRLLMSSPKLNSKGLPLFSKLFGSGSILFTTDRSWILRLLYAGLNLDDDAEIYIGQELPQIMLNFCASSLSDPESIILILLIVKKSVMFHNLAEYFVQSCGLIPWLSSLISFYGYRLEGDEKYFSLRVTNLVLKVINDVISSKKIIEWLQEFAFEQLSEFSSHLHSLVVGSLKLKENNELLNSMLHVMVSTLRISQKRKINKPHFTLSLEGLFRLYQAISADLRKMELNPTMELGLNTILMSAPVPVVSQMDRTRVSKLLTWAIPSALRSFSNKISLTKEPYPDFPMSYKEGEESLVSKLVRWVTASIILGSISDRFTKATVNFSSERSKVKTLQSLLEGIMNEMGDEEGNESSAYEALAGSMMYLQQLLRRNCSFLPSVVSALCLLLLPSASNITGRGLMNVNCFQIELLCSKIRCPAEANPAWRWSFDKPWQDRSLEQTETERIEEQHACQSLLIIFSNALGGESVGLPSLSHLDVEPVWPV